VTPAPEQSNDVAEQSPGSAATENTTLLNPTGRVLATLNRDGTRRWIRPRLSLGTFRSARTVVAWILMVIFVALPHVRWNDAPLILLNIPAHEFTLFGTTFLPTDTRLLMLLGLAIGSGVFLATALFGRVWCGWACPQTVYMEFLFRPIERLFEGSYAKQKRLDLKGISVRRVAKNLVFALIACFLAHTFLAYFVGWHQLLRWIQSSPADHPVAFLVMGGTTAAMILDFTWFREQTCVVACPYGRFQSVLLDRASLIVGYDRSRGEPRGKKKNTRRAPTALPVVDVPSEPRGDCVDCNACVITCPTGIDIRDGLQMECIHCTQCMDACDAIMGKLGRPKGLIRYTSQDEANGKTRKGLIRPRVVVYSAILLGMTVLLAIGLSSRGTAKLTVLRGLGAPYTTLPGGAISNQLRAKIQNQSNVERAYAIFVVAPFNATLVAPENPLTVPPGESRTTLIFVNTPAEAFTAGDSLDISIRITSAEFTAQQEWTLLGPAQ
jgi:cytochrome c oxidase accessory protein FixG